MSANFKKDLKSARVSCREKAGYCQSCPCLPRSLAKLLRTDASAVIGLVLRPAYFNAAGKKALIRLLEDHAKADPAARAVLEMTQRRGRALH